MFLYKEIDQAEHDSLLDCWPERHGFFKKRMVRPILPAFASQQKHVVQFKLCGERSHVLELTLDSCKVRTKCDRPASISPRNAALAVMLRVESDLPASG